MDVSSMLNADILDPQFISSMMSIMSCMNDMSSDSKDLKQTDLPVALNIDGLYSSKSLEFLFSAVSDGLIDKILDVFNRGDFNSVIELCKKFANMLNQMGVGNGIFQGEISNRVIHVIQSSINSTRFNKTKTKLKKSLLIVKNLKKQAKYITDAETKEKYLNAVMALKTMVNVINNVYENRKKINKEVVTGLKSLVFESTKEPIKLTKLEL